MKRSIANLLVVVVTCTLSFANARASDLIQNGSFEQPGYSGDPAPGQEIFSAPSTGITGWTVGGTRDVFLMDGPVNGGVFTPAEDGSWYVDLSGDGPPHATLSQDFATLPGGQYLLTFYIGSAAASPSAIINVQLLGSDTLLDTTLTALAPGANLNWLEETFPFTSDSTTTTLSFVDTSDSDDNASFIDNVSVTSVPEPATFAFLIPSTFLLLKHRR